MKIQNHVRLEQQIHYIVKQVVHHVLLAAIVHSRALLNVIYVQLEVIVINQMNFLNPAKLDFFV